MHCDLWPLHRRVLRGSASEHKHRKNGYEQRTTGYGTKNKREASAIVTAIALRWNWPINAEKGGFRYALEERIARDVGFALALHTTQKKRDFVLF